MPSSERFSVLPPPTHPPPPAATDSERAHAKVVQTLTLELEEARKAQQKAEQSAAMAAASAAALVASSVSVYYGRRRVYLFHCCFWRSGAFVTVGGGRGGWGVEGRVRCM